MIYITGDTHGDYNDFQYRLRSLPVGSGDTVIVCGDFGFVWEEPQEGELLSKLAEMPFSIAFVDGNHENFDLLEMYPVVSWNGGNAHRIAGNIFHLMRGQCFTIEGKTFFTFGGAYSVDKAFRAEGRSWWHQEIPDSEDYRTARQTLESCGYAVDYVLTHTVPQSVIHCLGLVPDAHDAELTGYLEWLYETLSFRMWYAGHFHVNRLVREKVQILYDEVAAI